MQISKLSCILAGLLRALVLDIAALSDCSVQHALQKDLKMLMAALKPLVTIKMKKKRLAYSRKFKHWTAAD
jgi:hypothetical protein